MLRALLPVALTAATLVACTPSPTPAPNPTPVPATAQSSATPTPTTTTTATPAATGRTPSASPRGPQITRLTMKPGQVERIALGETNPSIGHTWGLVIEPEADVASAVIERQPLTKNAPPGGARQANTLIITAKQAGFASLSYQRCFRTPVPCEVNKDNPAPIAVEITVQ